MPLTFGAGAGDDVGGGVTFTMFGNGRVNLVTGWWRPTTLTATRGLWSAGNVYGAEIDSTTSELRLRTDNTTDGQWTTTGVGLVQDEWKFLAFLGTQNNTGPAGDWRVWAGTLETPPEPVTVSVAVAPVGNFATTGTNTLYVGNKGTGTLAFQGDAADVTVYNLSSSVAENKHPFGIAAFGAISAVAEDIVYRRVVLPAWRGEAIALLNLASSSGNDFITRYMPLESVPASMYLFHSRSDQSIERTQTTVNGATLAQTRAPLPVRSRPDLRWVRR